MSVWNLLYKELMGTHDYIKPNTPATQKQIAEVEKVLDCKLPTDLKELLLEINGDNWFVFNDLSKVADDACSQLVITSKTVFKGRIKVILVGESLGF